LSLFGCFCYFVCFDQHMHHAGQRSILNFSSIVSLPVVLIRLSFVLVLYVLWGVLGLLLLYCLVYIGIILVICWSHPQFSVFIFIIPSHGSILCIAVLLYVCPTRLVNQEQNAIKVQIWHAGSS